MKFADPPKGEPPDDFRADNFYQKPQLRSGGSFFMITYYLSGSRMALNTRSRFKSLLRALFIGSVLTVQAHGQTNSTVLNESFAQSLETIVFVRHGEKAHGGLGQLTCRGLNRALALPDVLLNKFGKPQFIFAPNPTQKVDGGKYYYVRPIVTIDPTAIRCGLPVNTEFGYREIDGLEKELLKPQYQNSLVFVAWEHGTMDDFAKNLLKEHGEDPALVPFWPDNEYDTIFIFKITTDNGHKTVAFTIDHENLNNLSDNCPQPAK
jgi:hypothetical protein